MSTRLRSRGFRLLCLAAWGLVLACAPLRAQNGWTYVPQEVTRQNLWSIAFGDRTLVVAGEQGTILSYSYADAGWRAEASGQTGWLVGVGYGAGRFIVVGENGTILTSDDRGVTWTQRTSGTTTRLNAVAYGGGRWLVVGEQGVVLTSADGTTWTARPALGSGFLRALAYGQGRFLIGGANGVLYATTDGTTFTPVPIATTAHIEGAAISANRFWLVGSNGLWASATQLGTWSFGPAITTTTLRGLAARNADEAVAVAEIGAAVFRNAAWAADAPAQPFLGTAIVQGENEMIAVGFAGGIARADVTAPLLIVNGSTPVAYGSNVRLTVSSSGNSPSLTYQWEDVAGVPIPGATGLSLDITNITPATSTYTLRIRDQNGSGYQGVSVPLYPAGQTEVRDPGFVPALPTVPTLVVPQADGKLLVAGSFSVTPSGGATYGLARLNADGSLDPSFRAGEGIASTSSIHAFHVLADGRIYVRGNFTAIAGQPRPGVARLLSNGALDPSFQPGAFPEAPVRSALAPDGRLYVQAGRHFETLLGTLVRLAADGTIDPSFGPLANHHLVGVDLQGRVMAIQRSPLLGRLVRYLANGQRDGSYVEREVRHSYGTIMGHEDVSDATFTASGMYAISRFWNRYSLSDTFVKYLPDGGLDPAYRSPPLQQRYTGANSIHRADGGLWRVDLSRDSFIASSHSPTGERESSSHATPPDESHYQLLAIAPDGSLLATANRYTKRAAPTFIRVRPITGRAGRFINLSARAFLASADEPLIAGFVTAGNETTSALVRAIGPGLAPHGVPDGMRDPRLIITRNGATIGANDSWAGALAARFASVGAFPLTAGSTDAALELAVSAGDHTVVVTPAPGDVGTGLVELYHSADAYTSPRRFINVAARGTVEPARPLIAGFVVTGDVPVKVLIRAAGPALAAAPFNVPGTLADPRLTLYRGSSPLWDNDDWSGSPRLHYSAVLEAAANVGAFAFTFGQKDSAMVVTLAPGNYTAVVTGANDSRGVALVEVYEVR